MRSALFGSVQWICLSSALLLPRVCAQEATFPGFATARLHDSILTPSSDTLPLFRTSYFPEEDLQEDASFTTFNTDPAEPNTSSPDQMGDLEYNRQPGVDAPQGKSVTKRRSPSEGSADTPIPRFRNSCYQGISLSSTYLHDNASSGLAITSLDLSTTLAVPLGSMDNLLLITPFFRPDFLDAAPALNLPSEVFETGVRGLWKRPVNDRLSTLAILTPGVRTDFQNMHEAFRIFGLGLLIWQAVPDKLSLSGGILHTGREDFPVLPAAGLLWTPSPDWKVDIQFPAPRVSHRILKDGQNSETWSYLSGAFGGNSWAVVRPDSTRDELTLRDYRLITGLEHILPGNHSVFGEVGLVFGRSVEFASSPETTELDSSWMLRCGITF
ncbi:MAG: DUF6268 family outer membrane beta-barrel protein [Planctomycetia bacterium]